MIALVEFLRDPDLDERLTSDPKSGCFAVEFGDHPCWEVDVHPPMFLAGLREVLGPLPLAIVAMAVLGVSMERRWTVRERVWRG